MLDGFDSKVEVPGVYYGFERATVVVRRERNRGIDDPTANCVCLADHRCL